MSDDMLHAILQMPPDLWSDKEIWQRHARYCEASKRIIELEHERDEFASALRRISGMYSSEKSTFQLACLAYEMACVARLALIGKEEA